MSRLKKSDFANVDARVRCPTPECFGDLVLFPTGASDDDGIPEFAAYTVCPLCRGSFEMEEDMSDRDLYLRVSWLRANPSEGLAG